MKYFFSYLAGLIDADGSIYIRLKKNNTHKFDYQIMPSVVIFQHKSHYRHLNLIKNQIGYGNIRKRNDNMLELVISKRDEIKKLLLSIKSFLIIKRKRADLMLKILRDLKKIETAEEFMHLLEKIDKFSTLNFSTNRKINAAVVGNHLRNKGILTP